MNQLIGVVFLLTSMLSGCSRKMSDDQQATRQMDSVFLYLDKDTVFSGMNKNLKIRVCAYPAGSVQSVIIRKGNKVLKDLLVVPKDKLEVGENDSVFYQFSRQVNNDFLENQDTLIMSFSVKGQDGKEYSLRKLKIDNRTGLFATQVHLLARVTGADLKIGNTFTRVNANHTASLYDVGCTDLGIMWAMDNGKIGVAFGDTQGQSFIPQGAGGPNGGNWRSNVLGFSNRSDQDNLDKGLVFSGMLTSEQQPDVAVEFIHSPHNTSGTGSYTAIPTGAIHANGKDYIHYMDVRSWGEAGKWLTNFSGFSVSEDNGRTWMVAPGIDFAGNSNFAQVGMDKKDGFIYIMGTPSGRVGAAYLARVAESGLLDKSQYSFWNKTKGWVKGISAEKEATVVVAAPVSELSIHYSARFKRWLLTYLDPNRNAIVLKQTKDITGPWSDPQDLVSSTADNYYYGGLYGGFMYPLETKDNSLYFTMSIWYPYNVFWMRADLKLVE